VTAKMSTSEGRCTFRARDCGRIGAEEWKSSKGVAGRLCEAQWIWAHCDELPGEYAAMIAINERFDFVRCGRSQDIMRMRSHGSDGAVLE